MVPCRSSAVCRPVAVVGPGRRDGGCDNVCLTYHALLVILLSSVIIVIVSQCRLIHVRVFLPFRWSFPAHHQKLDSHRRHQ
jgi:hypothetical protein